MGKYTFAANSEKLEKLADHLTKGTSETVSREIGSIYSEIGNLSDSWDGTSYQQFSDGCHAYEGALNTIPAVLGSFATAFTKAAGGVEGLKGEVEAALQEIS